MEEFKEFEEFGGSLQEVSEMGGKPVHEQFTGEHGVWRSQVQVAVETGDIAAP